MVADKDGFCPCGPGKRPTTFTMEYRPLLFGITMECMVKQSKMLNQFQDIEEFIGSEDIELSVAGSRISSPRTIAATNLDESVVYRPAVVNIQKICSGSVHAFDFVRAICEVLSSNFDVHFDPCCQFRVHVGMYTRDLRFSVSQSKLGNLIAFLWTVEPELSVIQEKSKVINEASHPGGEPSRADALRMSMREYAPLSTFQHADCADKEWLEDVFEQQSTQDPSGNQQGSNQQTSASLSDEQRLEIISRAPGLKQLYALVIPERDADNTLETGVPSINWSQLRNPRDQVISFGHHGPTLDPDLVINWITVCIQLVKYASSNRAISTAVKQCQRHLNVKDDIERSARTLFAFGPLPNQDVVDRCVRKVALDRFLRQISLCEQADFYWDRFKSPVPPYLLCFRPRWVNVQIRRTRTSKDNATTSNTATDNANDATMDNATMEYATMDNAAIDNATVDNATTHNVATHNTTANIIDNMDDMFGLLDDESFNSVVDNFYG